MHNIKSEKLSFLLSCVWLFITPWTKESHGILQARILEWVAFPFSRGSFQSRDQTQVSTLQMGSLPAEPEWKPKNTGVGSLSLFQGIFLTQIRTGVSYIVGGFFTNWATRETLVHNIFIAKYTCLRWSQSIISCVLKLLSIDVHSDHYLLIKVCAYTLLSQKSEPHIQILMYNYTVTHSFWEKTESVFRYGVQGDASWDREANNTFHSAHWWWCCDTQARAAERCPRNSVWPCTVVFSRYRCSLTELQSFGASDTAKTSAF